MSLEFRHSRALVSIENGAEGDSAEDYEAYEEHSRRASDHICM